jgi:2-polyprenyl-3-methyl-5-hydroxy-6-metoxy-1,4-benzoquinol methylase
MGDDFTDEDVRAAWRKGAAAWEAFVESGADFYRTEVHGPALLAACGPLHEKRVLDLGCGQGFFTRELARAGARVVGVDLSDELIARAREHEERQPLGIEYRVLGAATIDRHWPADSVDLVTACMSLQDMADPGAALRNAFAVLAPDGRMVWSVPHPCTDTAFREWERDAAGAKRALKVDRYFDSGPAVLHWNMARLLYPWDTPYRRHTLTQWSELIARAGFLIRRLLEPRPTGEQVRHNLDLDDCYRLPYFLIFDLVKPRHSPARVAAFADRDET